MSALSHVLEPLTQFERTNTLAWRWRYRWRTNQQDGQWHAEVQAGYADEDWKPTGACPRWGSTGSTEAEALERAVGFALSYWLR